MALLTGAPLHFHAKLEECKECVRLKHYTKEMFGNELLTFECW